MELMPMPEQWILLEIDFDGHIEAIGPFSNKEKADEWGSTKCAPGNTYYAYLLNTPEEDG
jgi:hypothetical protein